MSREKRLRQRRAGHCALKKPAQFFVVFSYLVFVLRPDLSWSGRGFTVGLAGSMWHHPPLAESVEQSDDEDDRYGDERDLTDADASHYGSSFSG